MKSSLKVFMLPTLHKYNKYCSALIRSIRHEGVDLQFMLKETRVLPLVALIRAAGLPQIIHLHWIDVYTIKPTWLRSLVATATYILYLLIIRILGIKIVWTIHDYINHNGKFAYLDIAIRRFTARLTDSIIVHTETAQTEIANLYKLSNKEKSKISVVPHGHFIEEYPNTLSQLEARQQLSIDKDIFVFGSVGYVRPYKGILQLIKAFRQIDGARVHLIIAGLPFDDSFGNAVKEAALGDSRIHLHLNFIEDENLQVFLNAANALVFPFSDSLTSGSLILAMSFGKAVVTSDFAFIGDILPPEGGLIYPSEDPNGLVRALREIQRMDIISMGKRNLERAQTLDWQSIATATTKVYYEILGNSASQETVTSGAYGHESS